MGLPYEVMSPITVRKYDMTYDESIQFDALYDSMWKCRRGKIKKASVARYVLHGIEETIKLTDELNSDRYSPRKSHTFRLTYPKERPCSSIHIRDRIVQRSLNDNVIYPAMTKSFIWDNMACQKGKGTTRAMDRLNHFLHRAYINNGNSVEGLYVLQADVSEYYKHMRHSDARKCFSKHLDEKTVGKSMKWLQHQYPYKVGYEPGSQMVQILGISMLDPMDHVVKERLRALIYERYMDDFYIISDSIEFLEECRVTIGEELGKLGMYLSNKKTKIFPLKKGINILGFTFKLTNTGKVIRIINPKNVKHERKKLFRMAQLVKNGEITEDKFRECYRAWKAHAEKGNSYKLIQRMDEYVKSLLKEIHDESNTAEWNDIRTAPC